MQIAISIFLAAMLPTVTSLVGILLNRKDFRELRSEISQMRVHWGRLETNMTA